MPYVQAAIVLTAVAADLLARALHWSASQIGSALHLIAQTTTAVIKAGAAHLAEVLLSLLQVRGDQLGHVWWGRRRGR